MEAFNSEGQIEKAKKLLSVGRARVVRGGWGWQGSDSVAMKVVVESGRYKIAWWKVLKEMTRGVEKRCAFCVWMCRQGRDKSSSDELSTCIKNTTSLTGLGVSQAQTLRICRPIGAGRPSPLCALEVEIAEMPLCLRRKQLFANYWLNLRGHGDRYNESSITGVLGERANGEIKF